MSRLRRVLTLRQPQEVTFFLFLAAFALVITVIYWFASYEAAGTVLLAGFTIATGALGVRLAIDPRADLVRERAAKQALGSEAPVIPPDLAERRDPGGEGPTAEGTGGVDRPFLDEEGRLPGESLAPFAVGVGVAIAATGAIFGLAPVLVGTLPLAWGAWEWLAGANAELSATEEAGANGARYLQRPTGKPLE
jgi:hypothetical protein